MKLMKCSNGHFYDGDVYSECPHCKNNLEENICVTEKLHRDKGPKKQNKNDDVNPFFEPESNDVWKEEKRGLEKELDDFNVTERLSPKPRKDAKAEAIPEDRISEPLTEDLGRRERSVRKQSSPPSDDVKTVGYSSRKDDAKEPLVGWLVGLNGDVYGEGFPLVTGPNNIGRGADMDVVLHGDPTVSRDRHAVIIYEPKGRQFYLQCGKNNELVYLDDNIVLETKILTNGCELCIGNTKLRFVAFCGEDFSWEMNA